MTDIKYKHIALDIYTLLLLAIIIFKNFIFLYNLPKKTKAQNSCIMYDEEVITFVATFILFPLKVFLCSCISQTIILFPFSTLKNLIIIIFKYACYYTDSLFYN